MCSWSALASSPKKHTTEPVARELPKYQSTRVRQRARAVVPICAIPDDLPPRERQRRKTAAHHSGAAWAHVSMYIPSVTAAVHTATWGRLARGAAKVLPFPRHMLLRPPHAARRHRKSSVSEWTDVSFSFFLVTPPPLLPCPGCCRVPVSEPYT